MKNQDRWVNCKVATGMTTGEYSIELTTAEGRDVSLFAPEDSVDKKNSLLRVNVLEHSGNKYLIYLPSNSFEIGSRFITVRKNDLK